MISITDRMAKILKHLYKDVYKNRIMIAVLFCAWGGMCLVFHTFCPMVLITGLPCPGCGLTRAFIAFFTLHPLRAFEYNPSFILWIAFAVLWFWNRYIKSGSTHWLSYMLFAVAVFTIAQYVWRMICFFPGSEPLVYDEKNLLAGILPGYNRLIMKILEML